MRISPYLAAALLVVALVALVAPRADARLDSSRLEHSVRIVSLTDLSAVRTADITSANEDGDDLTSQASTASLTCSQSHKVVVALVFNLSTEDCTVTPIYYNAAGTMVGIGTPTTVAATANYDAANHFYSKLHEFDTFGATTVRFKVSGLSAAEKIREIWAGTY